MIDGEIYDLNCSYGIHYIVTWQCGFLRVVDARGYGTVRVVLHWSGSGYFGEFSGYAFPIEQSDRVPRTGHKYIVHQGPGMVGYMRRRLSHSHKR